MHHFWCMDVLMPVFLLAIVKPDGSQVTLPGGGPLERELIESCVRAIVSRGVGVFRTEAQVERAVRAGIEDVVTGLKQETRAVVR